MIRLWMMDNCPPIVKVLQYCPNSFNLHPSADVIISKQVKKKKSPAAETAATLGNFKQEIVFLITGVFLQFLLLSPNQLLPKRWMTYQSEIIPLNIFSHLRRLQGTATSSPFKCETCSH